MKPFEELLEISVQQHGHLCAGQVIGVRMAMLGCRLLGIDDPKDKEHRKKLLVFVEIDRCATDAISSVTGCQLGKRTLRFMDYGINAATFINLDTQDAYRIVSTESSRDAAKQYAPHETDLRLQQTIGYQKMPEHQLFDIEKVEVLLSDKDMPGPPRYHAVCHICGQIVRDGKEVDTSTGKCCLPCSKQSYFKRVQVNDTVETNIL